MRRTIFGLIAFLLLAACSGPETPPPPEVIGDWEGRIEVPGTPLEIGVTFAAGGGTFDLPAQGLTALPLANLRVEGTSVRFDLPGVPGSAAFDGTLAADGATIAGHYTQAGRTVPFTLARGTLAGPARPQEPQPPFPYRSEDVTYPSGDLTLAGTLTLPEGTGPFTTVLMITGSGAQDRDETIAGHKPFLLVADTLTRAGYAVLRVDDRGVGGSGGALDEASYDDLAGDVLAGVAYLKGRPDIDPARIGLFGHSEGGYLGPLAALRDPAGIAFVIMMAGPAVSGEEVLVLQNQLLLRQAGAPADQVDAQVAYIHRLAGLLRAGDVDAARELTRARITEQSAALPEAQRPPQAQIDAQVAATAALRPLVTYDPAPALTALRVPVLAFYGDKDVQVPASQSEPVLRERLSGDPDATVRTFPALNHLMQPATTGSPAEYATIETTIAPEVLAQITGWLEARYP